MYPILFGDKVESKRRRPVIEMRRLSSSHKSGRSDSIWRIRTRRAGANLSAALAMSYLKIELNEAC
jgi:hypothetical protein